MASGNYFKTVLPVSNILCPIYYFIFFPALLRHTDSPEVNQIDTDNNEFPHQIISGAHTRTQITEKRLANWSNVTAYLQQNHTTTAKNIIFALCSKPCTLSLYRCNQTPISISISYRNSATKTENFPFRLTMLPPSSDNRKWPLLIVVFVEIERNVRLSAIWICTSEIQFWFGCNFEPMAN